MKDGRSRRDTWWRLDPMRVSVLVFVWTLAFLASGCAEEFSMPEELIGTYRTSEQRYAGRSLELTSLEVVFGLGEAGTSRHVIKSLSREEDRGRTLYTLAYAGHGGADRMIFYHDDARHGEIVLQNLPTVVWTRQGGGE